MSVLSDRLNASLSHQTPRPENLPRIEALRAAAKVFGAAIEANCVAPSPPSEPARHRALAITALEDSLMRAVKSVVLE